MVTEVGTMSTRGQITIPKLIREALGVRPGDKLRFDFEHGKGAILRKAETPKLTEILDKLGSTDQSSVVLQRRLRREWSKRARRR